jgi:hypothetical protein
MLIIQVWIVMRWNPWSTGFLIIEGLVMHIVTVPFKFQLHSFKRAFETWQPFLLPQDIPFRY